MRNCNRLNSAVDCKRPSSHLIFPLNGWQTWIGSQFTIRKLNRFDQRSRYRFKSTFPKIREGSVAACIVLYRTAKSVGFKQTDEDKAMKSFTSNTAKTIWMGLGFIAIAPLTPVITLMHVSAWLCDEPQEVTVGKRTTQPASENGQISDLTIAAWANFCELFLPKKQNNQGRVVWLAHCPLWRPCFNVVFVKNMSVMLGAWRQ